MKKCASCGKKGLFLKLSIHNLCVECEEKYQEEEKKKKIAKEKDEWIPPIINIKGVNYFRGRYYTDCRFRLIDVSYVKAYKDMPINFKITYDGNERYADIYSLDNQFTGRVLTHGATEMICDFVDKDTVFRANIKDVKPNPTFTVWTYFNKLTSLPSLSAMPLSSTNQEYENYAAITNPKNTIVELNENTVVYNGQSLGEISEEDLKSITELKKEAYVFCALFGMRKTKDNPIITIKAYYQLIERPEEEFSGHKIELDKQVDPKIAIKY